MSYVPLRESLTFDQARVAIDIVEGRDGKSKDLYMSGIFIQGGVRNQNQRVYPVNEITKAVKSIKERIDTGYSVLGEADHPDDLQVNLDRVSHMITEINMDGPNGIGKLKILPTPMGNIVKTLLESGVKLGVSSRGSGNVGDNGEVKDFEVVTVDIVANPSAQEAYPKAIYEQVMMHRRQSQLMDVAAAAKYDSKAQKYLEDEVLQLIKTLKI
jgi:Prohead core protein serine protease